MPFSRPTTVGEKGLEVKGVSSHLLKTEMGKFLDNAPVGNPKQYAFWEISHFSKKHVNIQMRKKELFCQVEHESGKIGNVYVRFKCDV